MRPRVAVGFGLLALLACAEKVVEWSDVSYPQTSRYEAAKAEFAFTDRGSCQGTVRVDVDGDSVATWWSIRSDSSSVLMFSGRTSTGWTPPVAIDTTDSSRRGCNRPAPSIAANAAAGYVHIAYFLEPASGPGVFFTHSMDSTGFHDPVSISFGKRTSEVSVASDGDMVAVAYQEPNAERGQIWIALSETMGHIFESRLPVSGTNEVAHAPVVRLEGTNLEVEWLELIQADSGRRTRIATRTGTWK